MIIQIGLGHSKRLEKDSFVLGTTVIPILEALVLVDRAYLRSHRVPSIYRSGVVYREEPVIRFKGQIVESFDDIPTCLKRGWGDCDDLAPWRVAELREQGIDATLRVTWRRIPRIGRLFHILVRHPNGQLEDPSARLGMKGSGETY